MAGGLTLDQISRVAALARQRLVRPVQHHGRDCYSVIVTSETLKRTKRFLERTGDGVADITFDTPQDYRAVALMLRAGIKVVVRT